MLKLGNNRQTWMGASVLSVAVIAAVGVFALQPSARDIMLNSVEALETVENGHAVVQVVADSPEMSGSATIEVWGRAPEGEDDRGAFRMEVLAMDVDDAEKDATGMVMVSDGDQMWVYDPQENKVIVGTEADFEAMKAAHEGDHETFEGYGEFDRAEMEARMAEMAANAPETPEEAYDLLLTYFEINRAGMDEVAGGQADRLRLVPIPEQMPEEFALVGGLGYVWFDQATGLPVAAEYTGGALGEAKVTVLSFEVNEGVDDALFTFEIPEGAEVVRVSELEMDKEFESFDLSELPSLPQPAELPEGAALIDVVEIRGALVQRYRLADGGEFSVAWSDKVSMDDVPLPETDSYLMEVRGVTGTMYTDAMGVKGLLTWTEGETTYWVGGDLAPDALLTIAESIR